MHDTMKRTFQASGDLSPTDLALALDELPQTITNWSKRGISKKGALKVVEKFNVDMQWLLTGHSKEEPVLKADNFRLADMKIRLVPIIGFTQAGNWRLAIEQPLGTASSTYPKDEIFGVYMEGDSMQPLFFEGDLLIVDPMRSARPGDYVIAQNGDYETTFKKYRVIDYDEYGREIFELIPLNPDYPKIRSDRREIGIIGVVVERVQKF